MHKFLFLILIFFSVATLAQEKDIYYNFETAKEASENFDKPIFMLFTGSDWCPPCKHLEKNILSNSEFIPYLKENFIYLKLDFPRFTEISTEQKTHNYKLLYQSKYNERKAFPTIAIVDFNERKLAEVDYVGQPMGEFQEILDFILSKRNEVNR